MSKLRERAGPVDVRKPAFTAGEVALLCAVAPRTVQGWCDKGALRCHRLPAAHGPGHRGDRRIRRDALVAFMREHGITPPPGLESPAPTVALASPDAALAAALGPALGLPLVHCWGLFELGLAAAARHPAAVIDLALGRADCLRAVPSFPAVVLLAYEDDDPAALADWTPHVLPRAAPAGQIAACVRGVLEGAK